MKRFLPLLSCAILLTSSSSWCANKHDEYFATQRANRLERSRQRKDRNLMSLQTNVDSASKYTVQLEAASEQQNAQPKTQAGKFQQGVAALMAKHSAKQIIDAQQNTTPALPPKVTPSDSPKTMRDGKQKIAQTRPAKITPMHTEKTGKKQPWWYISSLCVLPPDED